MIRLMNNNFPWGYIRLDHNSGMELGYVSPRLIEINLKSGSARFTTFKEGEGHFTVEIEAQGHRWQKITGLDTDFVIFLRNQVKLYTLDDKTIIKAPDAAGEIIDTRVNKENGVATTKNEEFRAFTNSQNKWWEAEFYKIGMAIGWKHTLK